MSDGQRWAPATPQPTNQHSRVHPLTMVRGAIGDLQPLQNTNRLARGTAVSQSLQFGLNNKIVQFDIE